jgi:hypothetical protein
VSSEYGPTAHELEVEPVSEQQQRRAKAHLLEELAGLNVTQRQHLLASRFLCRPDPAAPPDRNDYLTIRRDIVGNRQARIVNRCRFDETLRVDENHIAMFCCNPGFARCPFWRSKDDIAV